eukprot:CAMPEP_0119398076 /NCGR_PEP_ID=MMETSP1334-20130426/140660_1 /TAXON_ID=127549 /ORGANISM="Calcidiscus leptoporus, Strain RCC1130" /LENGTH=711 /DNA_ID=CAMNT_0007421929 /DNA_START=342 /DNA_END=2477 /DNA_ORIENTATION=-
MRSKPTGRGISPPTQTAPTSSCSRLTVSTPPHRIKTASPHLDRIWTASTPHLGRLTASRLPRRIWIASRPSYRIWTASGPHLDRLTASGSPHRICAASGSHLDRLTASGSHLDRIWTASPHLDRIWIASPHLDRIWIASPHLDRLVHLELLPHGEQRIGALSAARGDGGHSDARRRRVAAPVQPRQRCRHWRELHLAAAGGDGEAVVAAVPPQVARVRQRGAYLLDDDGVSDAGDPPSDRFPHRLGALRLESLVLGVVAGVLPLELLPDVIRLVAGRVGVDHVVACRRERRVEKRRDGDDDHIARRVDRDVPRVDDRPLRWKALRQSVGAHAEVQVHERLAKRRAAALSVAEQPPSLLVELGRDALADERERRVQVRVRDDRLARRDDAAAGELHGGSAPSLRDDLAHRRRDAHGAPRVLRHAARKRGGDRAGAPFGEVHNRALPVEVLDHVSHDGGERAVGRQALQQEGNQIEVVLQEGVPHTVGLQIEGSDDPLGVCEHAREGERVAQPQRQQHARVAAHRSGRQAHHAVRQWAKLRRQPLPVLERGRAAVPPQDLLEVLGADGELVPVEGLGQVRAPRVVRDPLWLLADHLEDVLERVGRGGRRKSRVKRRSCLELEDGGVRRGGQLRRGNRPAVEADREFVRAAADLVVRFEHAHLEAAAGEERRAGEPAEAGADDDDVHLLGRCRAAHPRGVHAHARQGAQGRRRQ